VEFDLLALQPHLAARGAKVAGHDLDQSRLAGTVIAHQPQHLAGVDLEIDPGERLDRAEILGNTAQLE
jgi:hypothetical protein